MSNENRVPGLRNQYEALQKRFERFKRWRRDQTGFRHSSYWLIFLGLVISLDLGIVYFCLRIAPEPALHWTNVAGALHWTHAALGLAILTTALVAAPFFRFLASGWNARYDEFRNRLTDKMLIAYLQQYWEQRMIEKRLLELPAAEQFTAAGDLFSKIYREQYGKSAFLIPIFLLATIVFIETFWLVLANGKFAPPFDLATIDVDTASISGAYLFAVGDAVLSVRRRSLNVADVYWYALRMLVAIPVGAAVAALAPGKTHHPGAQIAALAFGTLPIGEFMKTLRRLPYWTQGVSGEDLKSDQLTKLEGVTITISDLLGAEGVTSVDQLIGMDPVLLAIRTGLPFDLILNVTSQALVRRTFTDSADRLMDIGLANVEAIGILVKQLDNPESQEYAVNILKDATARLQTSTNPQSPQQDSVEFCFRLIASSSFTAFLSSAN